MRRIFSYFSLTIVLVVFLSNSAAAKRAESISLPFKLDNKSWTFGSQTRMGTFLVPKGQTVQNWRELITLQFYPNFKKTPPKEFMNHFLAHLHKNEPAVKSKYISSSFDNALAEWNISNSKRCPNQHGLDRVMKGPQGLHVIHYAIKTNNWSQTDRNKWLNILNKAKISKAQ